MRAIILAAGRGQRMGVLTENRPKPLLSVAGNTLIEHVVARLRVAGIVQIVINHAYLGQQIVDHLGDGSGHGVSISYAPEPVGALETGGGILQALPLLGPDPFIAINADVYSDFPISRLPNAPSGLAHLVLVPNPLHHPGGDFAIQPSGYARAFGSPRWTMAGIGVYKPQLWRGCKPGPFRLPALLRWYMPQNLISAELYRGDWFDIGNAERLHALDQQLINRPHPS